MRIIAENEEERKEIRDALDFIRNFRIVHSKSGRQPVFYESSTLKHPWVGEEIKKGQDIPLFYSEKFEELKNIEVEVEE